MKLKDMAFSCVQCTPVLALLPLFVQIVGNFNPAQSTQACNRIEVTSGIGRSVKKNYIHFRVFFFSRSGDLVMFQLCEQGLKNKNMFFHVSFHILFSVAQISSEYYYE